MDIWPGPDIEHVADAAQRLPFPDNTFESILAVHILEHLPREKMLEILVEWKRVLVPAGVLQVHVPDGIYAMETYLSTVDPANRWHITKTLLGKESDERFRHQAIFDPETLRLWFKRAGFRILHYGRATWDRHSVKGAYLYPKGLSIFIQGAKP